jgi:hypothetical protein
VGAAPWRRRLDDVGSFRLKQPVNAFVFAEVAVSSVYRKKRSGDPFDPRTRATMLSLGSRTGRDDYYFVTHSRTNDKLLIDVGPDAAAFGRVEWAYINDLHGESGANLKPRR